MKNDEILRRLQTGAERALASADAELRRRLADEGQHPHAIVVTCSDSRVIPELLFGAGPGELFVIRVAGNVLDNHQLGSIEYAAAHLHCPLVLVLGHTGCGAVDAALSGDTDGFIRTITDEILRAVGDERDPDEACRLNVRHAVDSIRDAFREHPEIAAEDLRILGAVYDIRSGRVDWL